MGKRIKSILNTFKKDELINFLENTRIGIHCIDLKGTIIWANRFEYQMLGYKKGEFIGKKIKTFHLDQKAVAHALNILSRGKALNNFEAKLRCKDNSVKWVLINSNAHFKNGKFLYSRCFTLDITPRKEAEEGFRRNEEVYRLVVENASDLISLIDLNGKLLYASPSYQSILGYAPPELIDNNVFNLIHPEDIPSAKLEFSKVLAGQTGSLTVRARHKDGRYLIVEGFGSAIFNEKKEPYMILSTAHDITERVQSEKRKDEFISTASHELKTPITTIKGFTQILRDSYRKDPTLSSYINKMDNQIDRLTKLVNDLLDVSKMKSGKLEFEKEEFDMCELAKEIVEEMQLTLQNHKIYFEGSRFCKVLGDKYRLSQVLVNLISNAVKYSPKSNQIFVKVSRARDDIYLRVQDFGIGISKKEQPKIFERFYQTSNRIRTSFSGLGLGLFICAEIVKRHHGKIWVESEKKKGSTFIISLPKA